MNIRGGKRRLGEGSVWFGRGHIVKGIASPAAIPIQLALETVHCTRLRRVELRKRRTPRGNGIIGIRESSLVVAELFRPVVPQPVVQQPAGKVKAWPLSSARLGVRVQ